MDNSPGLKLFADDASQVQLPSSNINIDSSLQETGLKDAIEGETVDRLVIPKDSVIDPLNYLLHNSCTHLFRLRICIFLQVVLFSQGSIYLLYLS